MAHQTPSPISRPLKVTLFLGCAGLLLSGCTSGTAPQATVTVTAAPETTTSPSASGTPAATSSSGTPGATGTPEAAPPTDASSSLAALLAAVETALANVPGEVTGIESENGGKSWEVTIFAADDTEHEIRLSADGTVVLAGPHDQRSEANEVNRYKALIASATLDYADAAEAMVKEVPQGFILELGLDSSAGTTVWEADVRDGSQIREVSLDAATGKVVKNEVDN